MAVPALTPVTMPVAPTLATLELLVVQLPAGVASDNAVVCPTQTLRVPVMFDGSGFTVTMIVAEQPVASVYVIVVVPPDGSVPVTTPVLVPTSAISISALLQEPPVAVSVSVVVDPKQTTAFPEIAYIGFTVNVVVT